MKIGWTALLLWAVSTFAGEITDPAMGYTITLPPTWNQIKTRDTQHHFKDGSGQYRSRISIVKYAIDKATYPTARDWTEAQFIAYKLTVENSVHPYGAVLYYDSTANRKLGQDWAPEAFSMLWPADGDSTYCEYLKYCARGDFGYEIYAIGDSSDMMAKVDFYAVIIGTISFSAPTVSIIAPSDSRKATGVSGLPRFRLDALGRTLSVRSDGRPSAKAAGIFFSLPVLRP